MRTRKKAKAKGRLEVLSDFYEQTASLAVHRQDLIFILTALTDLHRRVEQLEGAGPSEQIRKIAASLERGNRISASGGKVVAIEDRKP